MHSNGTLLLQQPCLVVLSLPTGRSSQYVGQIMTQLRSLTPEHRSPHNYTLPKEIGELCTVCFHPTLPQLALWNQKGATVTIRSFDGTELQSIEGVNAKGGLQFSPDGGSLLLCRPSSGETFDLKRIRIIDTETGSNSDIGNGFGIRAMAFPANDKLCARTFSWWQLPASHLIGILIQK